MPQRRARLRAWRAWPRRPTQAPAATAAQSRMLIAGMGEGTDVRIKLANNMFGKGVVIGERNFDGTYPVAGLLNNGQQAPASNLFHPQQVYTVAEYERPAGDCATCGSTAVEFCSNKSRKQFFNRLIPFRLSKSPNPINDLLHTSRLKNMESLLWGRSKRRILEIKKA